MEPMNETSAKIGEGLKVLVIDDEKSHAEAVAESLERIGYECASLPADWRAPAE